MAAVAMSASTALVAHVKESPCPARGGSQCFVMSEYTNMDKQEYHAINKGCAEEKLCGIKTYLNNGEIQIYGHYNCCSGENCNKDNYNLTPDNGESNGKECPACLKVNSSEACISEKNIVCKHEEDRCYTYFGTVIEPDGSESQYSEKGCLSPSFCDFGFDLAVSYQVKSSSVFQCT
ncbi:phospholipase A2 inhibitor gamma subunit B-like [Ascaphus truei]|uniref:phospholipase A2 inhibitor gamma subunit B-like n=1 Tax=Ascaphus truei TaxID=8439 RepID=UPI003F5957BB